MREGARMFPLTKKSQSFRNYSRLANLFAVYWRRTAPWHCKALSFSICANRYMWRDAVHRVCTKNDSVVGVLPVTEGRKIFYQFLRLNPSSTHSKQKKPKWMQIWKCAPCRYVLLSFNVSWPCCSCLAFIFIYIYFIYKQRLVVINCDGYMLLQPGWRRCQRPSIAVAPRCPSNVPSVCWNVRQTPHWLRSSADCSKWVLEIILFSQICDPLSHFPPLTYPLLSYAGRLQRCKSDTWWWW